MLLSCLLGRCRIDRTIDRPSPPLRSPLGQYLQITFADVGGLDPIIHALKTPGMGKTPRNRALLYGCSSPLRSNASTTIRKIRPRISFLSSDTRSELERRRTLLLSSPIDPAEKTYLEYSHEGFIHGIAIKDQN